MGTWVMKYFDKLTFTNLIWKEMDADVAGFFGWCIIIVMVLHWCSEFYSYKQNYTKNTEYKVYGFVFSLFLPYIFMVVALQLSIFGIAAVVIYLIVCWNTTTDKDSRDRRINWTKIVGEEITGHLTLNNVMYRLRCYCLKNSKRREFIDKLKKEQQEYLAKYSHITI